MKNKQKLLFLFLLLFLFFPLFSFAQFIATNAPCEPEIIPPYGKVGGVYCPYCRAKGEFLHLKWDLKANFQDPVCGIECWGPSGDQCYNWSSAEQWFDENGRSKTKLKPKDDLFVKNPPGSPRSAVPGTNLQVYCWEKNDPNDLSKKKTSAGIRVYSDNACGEPVVGEPCEMPFDKIVSDLKDNKVTPITEVDFKSWATKYSIDDLNSSGGMGSGGYYDLRNYIIQIQGNCGANLPQDPGEIVKLFDNSLARNKPLQLNVDWVKGAGLISGHSIIGLKFMKDASGGVSSIDFLDPNGPKVRTLKNCNAHLSSGTPPNLPFLWCDYDIFPASWGQVRIAVKDFDLYETKKFESERQSYCLGKNTEFCKRNISDYLETNFPYINNPGAEGSCLGWSDFVLRVAYLGDFVGYDYHPNDGKIVGRDCDENHYPINKSLRETKTLKSSQLGSLNWLANTWTAWGNLLKLK